MNRLLGLAAIAAMTLQPLNINAQTTDGQAHKTVTVKNPWMWTDTPDPDILRVGDYYYLVTTTSQWSSRLMTLQRDGNCTAVCLPTTTRLSSSMMTTACMCSLVVATLLSLSLTPT